MQTPDRAWHRRMRNITHVLLLWKHHLLSSCTIHLVCSPGTQNRTLVIQVHLGNHLSILVILLTNLQFKRWLEKQLLPNNSLLRPAKTSRTKLSANAEHITQFGLDPTDVRQYISTTSLIWTQALCRRQLDTGSTEKKPLGQ
ncbi:hypothetical protein U1Q18_036337 [Sarracenia purpurea var. burkii]